MKTRSIIRPQQNDNLILISYVYFNPNCVGDTDVSVGKNQQLHHPVNRRLHLFYRNDYRNHARICSDCISPMGSNQGLPGG